MGEPGSSFPTTHRTLIDQLAHEPPLSPRWRIFFDLYGPVVYRFARRAGLSDASAEDVVAGVMRNFVSTVRGGFRLDASLGRFRSYLRTIVNHEILAQRHRERHELASTPIDDVSPPADAIEPDGEWTALERQERFRACLDQLRARVRPRDMLAFERYAVSGEPAQRVARELGMSTSRLYALKHELVSRLRELARQLEAELGEAG